jgi:hypothetical protein
VFLAIFSWDTTDDESDVTLSSMFLAIFSSDLNMSFSANFKPVLDLTML